MELTSDHIISNIHNNAEHNLDINAALIGDPYDAEIAGEYYLDQCMSLIARDVHACQDKKILKQKIQDTIIELSYLMPVLDSYLDEVTRQIELEKPEYSFNKQV